MVKASPSRRLSTWCAPSTAPGRLDGNRVGGVGDYLDVADRVILLEDYVPSDATPRAHEVTERFPPRAPLQQRGSTSRASAPSTPPLDLRGAKTVAPAAGSSHHRARP